MKYNVALPERKFWSRVAIGPGCWDWQAAKIGGTGGGYGSICMQGEYWRAHRAAWKLVYGRLPRHAQVLHHCDNRSCVKPSHLYLGNHADNMRDKVVRKRSAWGERQHSAKLTASQVREIRALGDSLTRAELGRRYGVRDITVLRILRRQIWRHLED